MGKESHRQMIWAEIRKQKEFTINGLAAKTNLNRETIETYLSGLRKAEFVELVSKNSINRPYVKTSFCENSYILKKDVGIDAPRVTRNGKILSVDITQDLWRSMRILKDFSAQDLLASTPRQTTIATIQTYCLFLCRAKYLRRKENGRYQFARFTGAKAPRILRVKAVFDPNLNKIVYQQGVKNDIY